jgi:hypothetical protein
MAVLLHNPIGRTIPLTELSAPSQGIDSDITLP